MRRYYITDRTQPKGFIEVTGAEYVAMVGDDTTRPYANKVYRGAMTLDEVPVEYREAVSAIVQNKIVRCGVYNIPDFEALNIITGGAV